MIVPAPGGVFESESEATDAKQVHRLFSAPMHAHRRGRGLRLEPGDDAGRERSRIERRLPDSQHPRDDRRSCHIRINRRRDRGRAVTLTRGDVIVAQGTSGKDGQFVLVGIAPGTYSISANGHENRTVNLSRFDIYVELTAK